MLIPIECVYMNFASFEYFWFFQIVLRNEIIKGWTAGVAIGLINDMWCRIKNTEIDERSTAKNQNSGSVNWVYKTSKRTSISELNFSKVSHWVVIQIMDFLIVEVLILGVER